MKTIIRISIVIIFSISIYAQTDTSLVYLKNLDSTIVTDVKYATKDNFTKQALYPSDKIYLRYEAASALKEVNKYLQEKYNYRIKVYDGYRPLSVQKIMWKILPDENFVANPAKGSRHNRGAAVDLTIIDSTGNELDMGTPYDDFTEKAKPDYPEIPDDVKISRKILKEVMEKFGFKQYETEWWHFDFHGWEKYSIIDIVIK